MSLSVFAESFQQSFDAYLDQKIASTQSIMGELNEYVAYIKDVCKKGKKIRPYNVSLMFHGYQQQNHDIGSFLLAFELIHSMAIIQDDWMDHAQTRRDIATYHSHFGKTIDQHIANALCIMAGDLCFTWANECAYAPLAGVDSVAHSKAMSYFFRMVEQVILGQMMDIHMTSGKTTSMEAVTNKCYYKTASYTFTKPLLAGAALAGIEDAQELSLIKTLGDAMGIAFQIRDDLKDMTDVHSDKDTFKDIEEGQQTLMTQYVFEHGNPHEQDFIRSKMGTKLSESDKQKIGEVMESSGAFAYAYTSRDNYLDKAEHVLDALHCNDDTKQDLRTLVQLLRS